MIKKFDVYLYRTIQDFVEGNFESTPKLLTLADGAVDFSTSGGHLDGEVVIEVNRFKQEIVSGTRTVPIVPTGPLDPPPEVEEYTITTVTYDGAQCRYQGPPTFGPGQAVRFDFVNSTPAAAYLIIETDLFVGPALFFPARGNSQNSGFFIMAANGRYPILCSSDPGHFETAIEGPILTAPSS